MKPDTNESQKPAAGTTKLIRGLRNMLKWGTGPCGGGGTIDEFSQGRQEAEERMRKELRRLLKEETVTYNLRPENFLNELRNLFQKYNLCVVPTYQGERYLRMIQCE